MSSTETRTGIPGPFYWALNVVADAWRAFRYLDVDGKVKRLGEGEFAVYHLLCRWVDNNTRECHRYQSTLCDWLQISPKTLRARLRRLIHAKLITVEQKCIDPLTGEPMPGLYKLLDIQEALRHARRLNGELDVETTPLSPDKIPQSRGAFTEPRGTTPQPQGTIPQPQGEAPHNKRQQDFKTEKTVSDARDTGFSSFSMDLPDALRGEQGRERFPRLGELAAWCREKLGRAVFPANAPPEEIEPFEEALGRLEGVARRCGQTAFEVITTRLSLRPEVREELLAAKMPDRVLGRQLNYAVEDYSARAARLDDDTVVRQPEPVAWLPASTSPFMITNVKPEWMTDNQWEFYKSERLLEESAASTARDCPVPA